MMLRSSEGGNPIPAERQRPSNEQLLSVRAGSKTLLMYLSKLVEKIF